ncbi:hypothetical protein SAMN06265365_10672 [Tistlia consotensis]|uniref:Uncharacterized protein n=1 Tax=Tistlia consotensis USBA 355 TaxID=560819 RepID=A0A1Y6BEI1_9PROT|nr:hypothetical protein [Tistlia consotensis]SMF03256.1 hypothetical protein SAMN05428998_103123 [Tistlia consotensis USBA 355]SNR53580.1 hypothetical protein SAMN06265365_10672 [Tistlia consotensis]
MESKVASIVLAFAIGLVVAGGVVTALRPLHAVAGAGAGRVRALHEADASPGTIAVLRERP